MAYVLDDLSKGGFTPMIEIKIDGEEVAGEFYSVLIKATVRDEAGQKSDQLTLELDDRHNQIARPRDKAKIEVWLGYKETGIAEIGTYEMQTFSRKWDDGGETVTIQANAADLKTGLKGGGREHFEDTNVGDVISRIAKRNKLTPEIHTKLKSIPVEYLAHVDSSDIDFLTNLADALDAVIKPMGDKLVATPRGEASSASGKKLITIEIAKSDTVDGEITPNSRAQYGKVETSYIDQKTGKRVVEKSNTGLDGPTFTVREPLPSSDLAKKKGQAEAKRLTRNTAQGHVTLAQGRPEAKAEADVVLGDGFVDDVAGEYRADSVEHTFDNNGFRTKIELKAKEDGSTTKKMAKESKKKGGKPASKPSTTTKNNSAVNSSGGGGGSAVG